MKKFSPFLLVLCLSVLFFCFDACETNNETEDVNPVPVLTQLSPAKAPEAGEGFTLTVKGSSFISTSKVVFGNTEKATTYVSATELKAEISTADITPSQSRAGLSSFAEAKTVTVLVRNPPPGGGDSNRLDFTINDTWEKTYGGSSNDSGSSVKQTADGGFIIAGYTASSGSGLRDVYLIKTDNSGIESWAKTFGGSKDEWGGCVQQTSDDGYVLTGRTESYGAGDNDVYLIKTDNSGNKSWTETFGGLNWENGFTVQQITGGGYIIFGDTESFGSGSGDFYLIKTDASGNKVWDKTYGGSKDECGYSAQRTADGGYILVGFTDSYGAGSSDVYLVKTDGAGNESWAKTFGGSNDESGSFVQQTSDGGYIIVGTTKSYGQGNYDVYLIKTNAAGTKVWDQTFGGSSYDWGDCVQQTSDGGYVIVGVTDSYGAGGQDVYLIKTDASGNKSWEKTFGGAKNEAGRFVQEMKEGGYIIVGETSSYGEGGYDVYLIKTDDEGNVD